jgi:MFS family permease
VNDNKPAWPIASLIVLTGLNLLDYLDRQLLASVLPLLQKDLGLRDTQAGWVATAFMLGYFLTSPLFGYLGDRLPRRWLIAAGVFVWSLGTLLSGHASGYWSLLLFRVLVGFGEASFGTISPGWIADLFPPRRRNNAISWFYLAMPVGSALGYILGGWIAARHGWRAAFLFAGYPGLLLAFVLFLLREPKRGATEATPDAISAIPQGWWSRFETAPFPKIVRAVARFMAPYFALFKFSSYALLILGFVAQTFAMGGFAFWAPTFLVRIHHMELSSATAFFGQSLVVTGLLATLGGGYLATAWQRRTGTGYSWVLALSAILAVPAAFAAFSLTDLAAAKVALVIAMFMLFLSTGPLNTLILETVPVRMRASAVAASIFCIHMFGDLWSQPFIGSLSDKWGNLQRACFWTLPGALVVSSIFWGWLVVWTKRAKATSAAT